MKAINSFAAACVILVAVVAFYTLPVNSQNPNAAPQVVVEQYRILSGVQPKTLEPKPDQQVEAELNALAAQGWKVRAVNQKAIILAR
jgi:hypothetical protein